MGWEDEKLFFSGDDYFSNIIEKMRQAQSQILFEVYIYSHDEIGLLFDQELIAAKKRGIEVLVLVDGIGSQEWIKNRLKILEENGIQIRIYHPFLTKLLIHGNRFSDVPQLFVKFFRFLSYLNRRDHRKLIVIDQKYAWVGSYNIHACHSETYSTPAWLDAAIRITGGSIKEIIETFHYIWKKSHSLDDSLVRKSFKWNSPTVPKEPKDFKSNLTILSRHRSTSLLKKLLGSSQHRVWMTNPYIAPTRPILMALLRAAKKGIDVRIYLSPSSDVFFMPWVAQAHYRKFLHSGVRIFEMKKRFIHAKCLVIDNYATIGSSNFNQRSLMHDLELDIILSKNETHEELIKQFHQIESHCVEVTQFKMNFQYIIGQVIVFFFGRFL